MGSIDGGGWGCAEQRTRAQQGAGALHEHSQERTRKQQVEAELRLGIAVYP
jgi:hypothetical protein